MRLKVDFGPKFVVLDKYTVYSDPDLLHIIATVNIGPTFTHELDMYAEGDIYLMRSMSNELHLGKMTIEPAKQVSSEGGSGVYTRIYSFLPINP